MHVRTILRYTNARIIIIIIIIIIALFAWLQHFSGIGKNFLGYLEQTDFEEGPLKIWGSHQNLGFCANFRFLLQWAAQELLYWAI